MFQKRMIEVYFWSRIMYSLNIHVVEEWWKDNYSLGRGLAEKQFPQEMIETNNEMDTMCKERENKEWL